MRFNGRCCSCPASISLSFWWIETLQNILVLSILIDTWAKRWINTILKKTQDWCNMWLYSHRLERVFLAAIPNRLLSSGARLNIGEGNQGEYKMAKRFFSREVKFTIPIAFSKMMLCWQRLRVYGPVFIWVESSPWCLWRTASTGLYLDYLFISRWCPRFQRTCHCSSSRSVRASRQTWKESERLLCVRRVSEAAVVRSRTGIRRPTAIPA